MDSDRPDGDSDPAPATSQGRRPLPPSAKTWANPATLTREQAAFLLGHRRYAVWMWHEVFWSMPDSGGTAKSVLLAIEDLRSARLALVNQILPNVFGELPRVLDEFAEMIGLMTKSLETQQIRRGSNPIRRAPFGFRKPRTVKGSRALSDHSFAFGSPRVPGEGHWRDLFQLVENALDPGSSLKDLERFGMTLGQYQLEIWRHDDATGGDDENWKSLPGIRPLVDASMALPAVVADQIPCIQELIRLGSDPDRLDQVAILRELFRSHFNGDPSELIFNRGLAQMRLLANFEEKVFAGLAEVTLELVDPDPTPGRAVLVKGNTGDTDVEFSHDLQGVAHERVVADQAESQLVPTKYESCIMIWDRPFAELRLNGILIKKVHPKNKDTFTILDAFQDSGFEGRVIDDPLAPRSGRTRQDLLEQAIKAINKNLKVIKFRIAGSGDCIRWDFA